MNAICIIKYVSGSDQTPGKLIAMSPLKEKRCFINCKINVRTGFLDPEHMGKGTKIDFLSQILWKFWGIEYLAHLAQTAILYFAYTTEKLFKGAEVEVVGSWSGTFFIRLIQSLRSAAASLQYIASSKAAAGSEQCAWLREAIFWFSLIWYVKYK